MKGTRKVGVIRHELLGTEVPIKLDQESMEFSAEFRDHRYQSRDGDEVREKILRAMEVEATIEWKPVIRVVELHEFAQGNQIKATAAVAISVTRFWVGLRGNQGMLSAGWDVPEDQRRDRAVQFAPLRDGNLVYSSTFTLPFRETNRTRFWEPVPVYLEHTAEMWNGLKGIEHMISYAREQLEAVLGSAEALDRIRELGAAALPSLLGAGEAP